MPAKQYWVHQFHRPGALEALIGRIGHVMLPLLCCHFMLPVTAVIVTTTRIHGAGRETRTLTLKASDLESGASANSAIPADIEIKRLRLRR